MRNLAPSVLSALPHVHPIAAYEAAFNARRRQAIAAVTTGELAGRVLVVAAQPTMSWVDGPRSQPRSPDGRFLPRSWLAEAELFLPADRAWFRHPVGTEGR